MSIESILSVPAVPPSAERPPVRSVPRARRHVPAARYRAAWGHLSNDRRFIHLKLILLGLILVAAMALEVPL